MLVYAPDVGHGFIKDDFRWIRTSAVSRVGELADLFGRHTGFYRPLVAVTFAANYAACGLDARGYGWTNLALAFLAAGLIIAFARGLQLPVPAAVLAGAMWLLNFHGINMAVLWVSGRTALLLVCFSVAAAWAATRGRYAVMAVSCLGALLSKEEAVLLPVMLLAVVAARRHGNGITADRGPRELQPGAVSPWISRSTALAVMCAFAPLAPYAFLRGQTGAMTLETAPAFYRFSSDPWVVLRNVVEYADRAGTLAAAVALAFALGAVLRPPVLDVFERRAAAVGVAWFVLGYGLTVFLPVRSSLYACLPSVGSVLVSSALASAWWRLTSERARQRVVACLTMALFVLLPVYRQRNQRWVRGAVFSTNVMSDLAQRTASLPPDALVVLHDDRSAPRNLASTFGTLIGDAVVLAAGRPIHVRIEPPLPDAVAAYAMRPADRPVAQWWLVNGRLAERAP